MKMDRKLFAKCLGECIANERRNKGWQKAYLFAEVAQISPRTLYSIEEGYRVPSTYTLMRICDALETTVQKVLDRVTRMAARVD